MPEVVNWVNGEREPDTVNEASFSSSRLLSLRTKNSAAYKGISTLLLNEGGLDFKSGEPIDVQLYFDSKIDIHHIFPQKYCKDNSYKPDVYNSIVNKTPLSARTNRIIQGVAPSVYLQKLQKEYGLSTERLDEILKSHLVDPNHLRSDDFVSFF